jgi:hypothetical protein
LQGVLPEEFSDRAGVAFAVWAELRFRGGDGTGGRALMLWATLLPAPLQQQGPPVAALEAAIRQGELVVALFWDATIYLYKQVIGRPDAWDGHVAILRATDWSLLAAASSIRPEQLRLNIDRGGGAGWRVEVIHRVPRGEQRTLFEQIQDAWAFRKFAANAD